MLNPFGMKKIKPQDMENLIFGQQHYGTQDFFTERLGQYHTIPVRDFPHFQFLDRYLEDPYGDTPSWSYLKTPDKNTDELRKARVDELLALYYEVKQAGKFTTPILVCKRPDGKYILIDGNHRAAIALKLGIPLSAQLVKPADHLRKISLVKGEYYGTGRLGMPYQSLFYRSKELVRGRRPDILERLKMVAPDDLKGKSLIDLGCNLGANCYSAVFFGVRSAVGVDYSRALISAAIRMNAYYAAPCHFSVHDLNDELTDIEPADTVFCFSVTSHLKHLNGLVSTLRKLTQKVLYFEGHSNTNLKNYSQVLNRDNFSKIELIGYNRDSIDRATYRRPFFRCEV